MLDLIYYINPNDKIRVILEKQPDPSRPEVPPEIPPNSPKKIPQPGEPPPIGDPPPVIIEQYVIHQK